MLRPPESRLSFARRWSRSEHSRRTCRTGLARLKIPQHIAERVLSHAQEKIPGTYDAHDYLEEKREALDKWAAHLQGLKA
jgi:hypothetical protein